MIDCVYIIVSKENEPDRYLYLLKNIPIHLNNYEKNNKIILYEPFYKNRDENNINMKKFKNNLLSAEKMLLATYIKLFKEIKNNNYKNVLILESDVLFVEDFEKKLNDIYIEWLENKKESLFLGNGCNFQPKTKKISNNLHLENGTKCTDSMIIDSHAINNILDFIGDIDEISSPIDHLLNNIMGKTIYGYWIAEPIIIQGSQNNTYKSTIQ
jgi:hypothetical protein